MQPIAVQLYSVRNELERDFEATIRRIAAMGYQGVEFAGNFGSSPTSAVALCRELGMEAPAAHFNFGADDAEAQMAELAGLGIKTVICAWLPTARFDTLESIKQVCDELDVMDARARAHGLRFAYHNHDFEFKERAGIGIPHEIMRDMLAPTVMFEIDTYWVKVAGFDPAAVLHAVGDRAPLIHLKDGLGVGTDPMLPLGQGIIDIPAVIGAATAAEWLVVELDSTPGDMMTAVDESLRYLKTLEQAHD